MNFEQSGLQEAPPVPTVVSLRLDGEGRVLERRGGEDPLPGAVTGRRLGEVLPAGAADRVEAALAEAGRTGAPACVEVALPEGEVERELEVFLVPEADGGATVVLRDVTARREEERVLRRSERHFRTLVENSLDVFSILDAQGVGIYHSPAIERVLGYPVAEILGTSAFERIHPEDRERCREVLRAVFQNPGTTRTVEFRYLQKNGAWREVEVFARTLRPDSAEEGAVINLRDITRRKRAEEALRAARESAEAANQAKSEFLSRMSHELRTPMNSILGFAQLLSRRELPPGERKGVDHILRAGHHLLNLINEVLDLTRIEASRQQLSLEPVQVGEVVQEALTLVRPLAAQQGCSLAAGVAGDPEAYVTADRQRLTQVLLNLLSNAIKYNRPGGQVWVTCGSPAEEGAPGCFQVRVHDTGLGIPAEKMDQLFVPFARLGAEQTGVEGTGLGLALSKRLVEAMSGTLRVQSAPGTGSTFTVELERAESPLHGWDPERVHAEAAETGPGGARRATLLYIEDNVANLSLIETIFLDRPEITLVPALQGRLGLDLAVEHHPDLILLDLHLPDIPGEEVLRRLRSEPRTRGTPVVVISADATPGSIRRLLEAGAQAYLTKPLDVGEFLETVDGILAARG